MDLDAYVDRHAGEWIRLDALSRRRSLTGAEADELLEGYGRVSTHLSQVRTSSPEPGLVIFLSSVLHRTRLRFGGTRTSTWAGFLRFFTHDFPAALYRTRRWWLTTMAVNIALAFLIGWYVSAYPHVQQTLIDPAHLDQLVNHDFESYYSENPATSFALRVWTNNAWVSAQAIAMGVLGLPVLYVLFMNTLNLGVIGGIMAAHGRAGLFFGLIMPHGLLELTCVFVAGGVGLRLFWSWVEPGDLSRVASMAAQGRRAVAVALGLVPVLLVCGVIEAFVTPSGLPTWARIAIGVLAWLGFMAYVFFPGRWACREGVTGDVSHAEAGDAAITVG